MGDENDETKQRPAARPVAAVVVETPLAHLDRVFEYAVPDELDADAVPGGPGAGALLGPRARRLRRRAPRAAPARRPADAAAPRRQPRAGADPRGARPLPGRRRPVCRHAERRAAPGRPEAPRHGRAQPGDGGARRRRRWRRPSPGPWAAYPAGPAWLRRVASGEGPAAAWAALPGRTGDADWPAALAVAAATALAAGRGALVVVPGPPRRRPPRRGAHGRARQGAARAAHRRPGAAGPLHRVAQGAARARQGRHRHAGRGVRARARPRARRLVGRRRRPARRAPRALPPRRRRPRPAGGRDRRRAAHRRLRAQPARAGGGRGGGARARRGRRAGPACGRAARHDRGRGPRRGARRPGRPGPHPVPRVACRQGRPRRRAGARPGATARLPPVPQLRRVPHAGPVRPLPGAGGRSGPRARPPACRWCGLALAGHGFECDHCGSRRLRSSITGARRTAEEIGRAFPGFPVHTSGSGEVLAAVGREPSLVIATPGAEPVADGGYTGVLLLDAWASLDLPDARCARSRRCVGGWPRRRSRGRAARSC